MCCHKIIRERFNKITSQTFNKAKAELKSEFISIWFNWFSANSKIQHISLEGGNFLNYFLLFEIKL